MTVAIHDIETRLWAAADELRANSLPDLDPADLLHLVLKVDREEMSAEEARELLRNSTGRLRTSIGHDAQINDMLKSCLLAPR